MTRILYFTRDYTTHDHRFLAALAKTNYEVYYLRLERRGHSLEERPVPAGIKQVPWKGGSSPARAWDGLHLLADLKRVIRLVKPDIIQAGPLQTCAFLVALAGFHPLVSMSWGYDLLGNAVCSKPATAAHRLLCEVANRYTLRCLVWNWITRFTLRRSAVMVGDCSTIRQKAIALGMNKERIVTFPWGIDLNHFIPPKIERPGDGKFTLLSTRSWEPIYGVDVLAQSFIQAAQHHPELHLIMLGDGSQAESLRQMFNQGGVLERVVFPGQVTQSLLPGFYQKVDLYISASHSDGTSISLLEAMACGCPVLVSDIPGNCEWVTPGTNGWLFPDGDADALAQAILTSIEQRQALPEMGRTARGVAEKRADWQMNFPQLFKAYALAKT